MSYGKIHAEIINSSAWQLPVHVRLLFVTMIAIQDRDGLLPGTVSGLARAANLTVEQVNEGIAMLSSPDPDSQSQVCEGRRIEMVTDHMGRQRWRLVNAEVYRRLMSEEDRRERDRLRKREKRASVRGCPQASAPVREFQQTEENRSDPDQLPPIAPPLGGPPKVKTTRARRLPEDWAPTEAHRELARSLGVDCDAAAAAMRDWSLAGGKPCVDWDARFRNWLRSEGKRGGTRRGNVPSLTERDRHAADSAYLDQIRADRDKPAPWDEP